MSARNSPSNSPRSSVRASETQCSRSVYCIERSRGCAHIPCWMWPTQFMSNALRRICLDMLWEQPPRILRAAHRFHADCHRRGAMRHQVTIDALHHPGEGTIEHMVQLGHHLRLVPEELLQILHPFEVADHHAPGVAQDIRDDEDLVPAPIEHLIG